MELLIMKFSPHPFYLTPLRPKYSTLHQYPEWAHACEIPPLEQERSFAVPLHNTCEGTAYGRAGKNKIPKFVLFMA
jgi:hypothetical protein